MSDSKPGAHGGALFAEAKNAVQEFQVRRLKRDFRDIRASAEYGPLCDFFASEIYSARDFSERNAGFRRVATQFRSILGEEIFHGLIRLLDLHTLTDRLDDEIASLLLERGIGTNFTEAQYEEAYRHLDNYDDRFLQLEMIGESFHFTHRVSQMTFIGMILKSAKVAAGLFTKDHAIELLDKAYWLMRDVRDIKPFTDEVARRELARLDRIYGRGASVPVA
jgi:hypothetical protein